MVYKGDKIQRYYVISKQKIRGHHVVTPFASRPAVTAGYVVVSAAKKKYRMNKFGYGTARSLPPANLVMKKRRRSSGYSLGGLNFRF